jgi:branched-chain amino acid transport system ATP-binding protein
MQSLEESCTESKEKGNQLLVVENISKSFGNLKAINDISFQLNSGGVLGVAGPNGAGKTTLFNVMSGIPFSADTGTIIFDGQPIQSKPAHIICQMGLARTFQKETVFSTLNVFENTMLGSIFGRGRLGKLSVKERALEVLEFVGLTNKINDQAEHLSLYEKKLLMLASALATRPKLLLLDEPAAGLNAAEMGQSAELIERIKSIGTAIILIEHQLPLLLKVSHRVLIINYGQKLFEGPPSEVVHDERVIEAYLGKRGRKKRDA